MSSARVEIDSDRIATIWLDSPGKRVNTLSREMWADLAAAIDSVQKDGPIGVIVTSAKSGTFCVGADLFELKEMSDDELDLYIRSGQEILNRLESLSMPTVARINGDCVGGGLELALACTVRLMQEGDYSLGLPELRLGLVPGWGGTVRLSRLIGSHAVKLILGSAILKPADARKLHVVDDVLAPNEFVSLSRLFLLDLKDRPLPARRRQFGHSEEFERVLQAMIPSSPAATKLVEVIRAGLHDNPQAGFDAERRALIELRHTPECQQALQAFVDRKKK